MRTYLLIFLPFSSSLCAEGQVKSIEEWDGFRRPCFVNRYVGVCLSGMGEGWRVRWDEGFLFLFSLLEMGRKVGMKFGSTVLKVSGIG